MATIFNKILNKEIKSDIVYEDDLCLAFRDVNPQAPVHILIIPKKEISSMTAVEEEDQNLLGHMMLKVSDIARQENLEKGFRVVINTNEHGGQSVNHLHLHILGGRQMKWPPG